MEEKLGSIFDAAATEEVLNGEEGHQKILDLIFDGTLEFPEGFTKDEVLQLIESVETPSEFSKESFIQHYNEILTILRNEIIPEPEIPDPEDEEILRLTPEFIAERLSDLQPIEEGSLSFAFTSFSVSEAEIADIKELSKFHALFYISLKTNAISDATPLNGLERLKTLNLAENKLVSFNKINLPSLQTLNLSQNKFCNVGQFLTPNLVTLNLSQNSICYIAPNAFEKLTKLQELDLSQNKLRTFKPGTFSGLQSLKILKLDQNAITALPEGSLDGLGSVEEINVGENSIEDVNGFAALTNVKKLDMHQTAIMKFEDLSVMKGLKNLNALLFDGTPVASNEAFKSDIILMLPWVESIDEEPISFQDRQDALELDKERKAQEEAERREREEAEREAKEANEEKEESNEQPQENAESTHETTEETQETETASGTYDESATYDSQA